MTTDGLSTEWQEWRLLVLDDLALQERYVEDWVFGEDLSDAGCLTVFQGSSQLPQDARTRWRLLRDLYADGLIELDDGEGGIPTRLLALRPEDVGVAPNPTFRGTTRISTEGAALWERERDIDWPEFHSWRKDFDADVAPGHFCAFVRAARRAVLDAAISRWQSATGLVVEVGEVRDVRPFDATYWKWLDRGFEQRLIARQEGHTDLCFACGPGPLPIDPWRHPR